MSSIADRIDEDVDAMTPLLQTALDQLNEESLLYNEAVGRLQHAPRKPSSAERIARIYLEKTGNGHS